MADQRQSGGRGVAGAAGDAGVGQVGRARPELDRVDGKAERVRADLRQRRPGALAHVVGAGLNERRPVAADHGAGVRLEHHGGEGRRADAPADEQPVRVAHLPRLERPS